jgi:two-component system response regulator MprA
LVIDDDQSVLRIARLSLAMEGFRVETAVNGLDGLNRVTSSSFDLIVLDSQMPQMDGRSFYRELRSRGHTMPVLILSAYGADNARRELDADGSVAKPFDPDTLVEKVRGLLGP